VIQNIIRWLANRLYLLLSLSKASADLVYCEEVTSSRKYFIFTKTVTPIIMGAKTVTMRLGKRVSLPVIYYTGHRYHPQKPPKHKGEEYLKKLTPILSIFEGFDNSILAH
jgi:hypothetical protein